MNDLFTLYSGRVARESDFVCYWFEKSRNQLELGNVERVGLLATQGIRGGTNREVLKAINQTGEIFWAYSDRDWILDGATVHVSMIGYDNGSQEDRILDGDSVQKIHADLSADIDLTVAIPLTDNAALSFMGVTPAGPFVIKGALARSWLNSGGNPNGRPNSDVVRQYFNGTDINRRPQDRWIVDFGTNLSMEEASLYHLPFEYVRENVLPVRRSNNRAAYREKWWLLAEARPAMRRALNNLERYIGTSMVSKHRVFSWINSGIIPANLIIIIARDDDYFFGLVSSRLHQLWARGGGTQLRESKSGSRYTPTSTFETFPFPWPPGMEPITDPRVESIAEASRELVEKRNSWLNPSHPSETEMKKHTLTNLYNARPTWLDLAHKKLNDAVFAAYGWPNDLTDEQVLERLLALNMRRASEQETSQDHKRSSLPSPK